jgi:hypothetical protein
MSSTSSHHGWATRTNAVLVGVAALFVLAFPVALAVDSHLDRTRPMYDDRAEMEWLQYQSVLSTGQARPLAVGPGESTEVAGEQFTPSAGVSVVVRAEEPDRPCVQASNEHGDVTEWACVDLDHPPVDPDPEDVDLATAQAS